MRILKFRIKNYRSIVDLGDCRLHDSVTIFAGLNEVGKSAVLEALYDFNAEVFIREEAVPLGTTSKPEIEIEFGVETAELREILGDLEQKGRLPQQPGIEFEVTIVKHYPARYELPLPTVQALGLHRPPIDGHATEAMDSRVAQFLERFKSAMPRFILFNSFDDVFPNEIPFKDFESNFWIADLERMSDLKSAIVLGTNNSAKRTHKHNLNISLNKDFERFWTQDVSRLSIDWDSEHLHFWIEENAKYFPPALRSRGKRWHLAFYVRVSARARAGVKNIILIDEPGQHLHAKAQRDILSLLEQASETTPIMFSTHSPYLIEADKLHRIKLLQKTADRGTYVENNIHGIAGQRDALTPILTAIGMDLNQGVMAADKVNCVVVEGPSDFLYLAAFGELLGKRYIRFVAGGGVHNMPVVGTLLHGWGARVLYLFDNEQTARRVRASFRKSWEVVSASWVSKLNVDGSIEDVFERADFAKHVLNCAENEIEGKNSEHMRHLKKVPAARRFWAAVRSGAEPKVSEATLARFRRIFDDLENRFSNYGEAAEG